MIDWTQLIALNIGINLAATAASIPVFLFVWAVHLLRRRRYRIHAMYAVQADRWARQRLA